MFHENYMGLRACKTYEFYRTFVFLAILLKFLTVDYPGSISDAQTRRIQVAHQWELRELLCERLPRPSLIRPARARWSSLFHLHAKPGGLSQTAVSSAMHYGTARNFFVLYPTTYAYISSRVHLPNIVSQRHSTPTYIYFLPTTHRYPMYMLKSLCKRYDSSL